MFTTKNEHFTLFIFLIAACAVVFTYAVRTFKNPFQSENSVVLPFAPVVPTPLVTPKPADISEFPASDGKKNLTMEKLEKNTIDSYMFSVSTIENPEKQLVFTKDESKDTSLSVPFNAWSPNDAHFFLRQTAGPVTNYFVFNSNGKEFSADKKFVNVTEYFQEKYPDLVIEDVTGWAGDNLLLVNTKTKEGEPGYSYWFTVTTQTFTRLYTHFY